MVTFRHCGTPAVDLALDTINLGKQALVFVNSKRSAEKVAEDISKQIRKQDKGFSDGELAKLSEQVLGVLSKPTRQCQRIASILKYGVAFHHAGLHGRQKSLIEDAFREGKVKIIACTPTLAAGLDLPAFRAIIRDVRRFGSRGLRFIPVLEYLQICGRAGRPKYDTEGQAITICDTEEMRDEVVDRYIHGVPENIYSKLAVEPVLRTYLLSLIASRLLSSRKSIMEFFAKTFWAFQFKDMRELEGKIDSMLALLEEWAFITSSGTSGDFVDASELGADEKYRATRLGERVAQLYLDPLTGQGFVKAIEKAGSVQGRCEFSYVQLICNTLEMRPLLSVKNKEFDEVSQMEVRYESSLLGEEPSMYDMEYDLYLNSIKTAWMFLEWMEEKDEEFLLEKFNVRPGELRVKLNIADWLVYCVVELAAILDKREVIAEAKKTRLRLRFGVKEEVLPLLKLEGVGRVRARKLFANKVRSIKDLKAIPVESLAQLVGPKVAASLKKQVGIEVKAPLSVRKRKGQMSLGRFG